MEKVWTLEEVYECYHEGLFTAAEVCQTAERELQKKLPWSYEKQDYDRAFAIIATYVDRQKQIRKWSSIVRGWKYIRRTSRDRKRRKGAHREILEWQLFFKEEGIV